jgi:dUTP pyrophosphatase
MEKSIEKKSSILKFRRMTENAFKPSKGSLRAAGYDLFSAYNYVLEPRGKELIKTDLQIQIPEGCYGRVAPRSGLAWKQFIDVGAGVIDCDYRGNVCVILFNFNNTRFIVNKGDRIAQLICEKIEYPELQEEQEEESLDDEKGGPTRGSNGFGSSGVS